MILVAVSVVFVLSFAGIYAYEHAQNRKRLASLETIWSRAQDLIAGAPESVAPFPAVITGRGALAFHVEVVTKETIGRDNYDEVITRRIHEESAGAFAVPGSIIDFSNATLITEADTAFDAAVVYSSDTSMFAGRQQLPAPVYTFLAQRELPLPRQDQWFEAGFKVVIRERLIVPGTPLWIAHDSEGVVFDLGTVADARRRAVTKQSSPIAGALIGAALLGAVAGMIGSVLTQVLSRSLRYPSSRSHPSGPHGRAGRYDLP